MKRSFVDDEFGPRCPALHDELIRVFEVPLTAVVKLDGEEHLHVAGYESVSDDNAFWRAEPGAIRAYWRVHPQGLVDDGIEKLDADEIAMLEHTTHRGNVFQLLS